MQHNFVLDKELLENDFLSKEIAKNIFWYFLNYNQTIMEQIQEEYYKAMKIRRTRLKIFQMSFHICKKKKKKRHYLTHEDNKLVQTLESSISTYTLLKDKSNLYIPLQHR